MTYFVGVMSGTSLDGVDIVITQFDVDLPCKIFKSDTVPYPSDLRQALLHLVEHPHCALMTLGELDRKLGQFIAESVLSILADCNLSPEDIQAIGSHGHTVFHAPDVEQAFSLQIGSGHIIAEMTGITTIADFRQRDLAAGGQGAPLVPAFHAVLFGSESDNRAIVNIGGIANITVLNPGRPVLGFDTGPGNTLLDSWMSKHHGVPFDEGGRWASQGHCHTDLLDNLLADPYFQRPIPKSTGREYFHLDWLESHLASISTPIAAVDVQATLLALTSHSIVSGLALSEQTIEYVYVCGGGAHNETLMQALDRQLPGMQVHTTTSLGLDPDWVEACAFAWLAQRTLYNQAGNLPSVTGAKHPVILGAVYPA